VPGRVDGICWWGCTGSEPIGSNGGGGGGGYGSGAATAIQETGTHLF